MYEKLLTAGDCSATSWPWRADSSFNSPQCESFLHNTEQLLQIWHQILNADSCSGDLTAALYISSAAYSMLGYDPSQIQQDFFLTLSSFWWILSYVSYSILVFNVCISIYFKYLNFSSFNASDIVVIWITDRLCLAISRTFEGPESK